MKKRADNSCARVKRTRTRSGCLTCRKRHMKCDERVPVCQKCSKSKRTCVWGILAKYTNFTCYDPSSNGSWNSSLVSSFSRIIDQSFAVAKLYKDGPVLFKECRRGHTQEELAEAERILQQDLWAGKAPVSYKASPEFIHERETLDPSLTVPGVDNKNGFSPGDLQFLEAWKTMGMGMGVPEAVRCESPATWFRSPKHPEIKRIPVIAQPHDMQQGCVTRLIGAIPLGGADHFSSPTQLGSSVHARFAQRLTPKLGVSSPLSPVQNRGPLFTGGTPPEFRLVQNDAEKYINIVRVQKYFWMLDLFNDLRVWETCIPNFCVRLNQASNLGGHSSTSDETFLFNCILLCDENSSIDRVLEMCSWQLHMWQEFDMKEVELSSYAAFEKVLISVVFISLSMLIKSTQSGFFVSPTINKILANQGRLIHKLIAQYSRFPGTSRQKLGSTVFTEASFQAIIILRFFLKKTFQKLGVDYNPRDSYTSQAFSYDITYSDTMMHDTANFFTLTEQEVSFLCNDHNSFLEFQNDACSDAGQLCKTFWEMIIAEYRIDTRDRRMLPSPDSDLVPSETTLYPTIVSALLPNSRCLAISLCKAYQNKILGDNQMAVSPREIFNRIAASNMIGDEKRKWARYFDWTVVTSNHMHH